MVQKRTNLQKQKITKIIGRNLLCDEDYFFTSNVFITYRVISDHDIEIHIGYDKTEVSYSCAIKTYNNIKNVFLEEKRGVFNIIASIDPENIPVRILIRKFGFSHYGKHSIFLENGLKKIVERYALLKEDQ